MNLNTVAFKRRRILGEFYGRCETTDSVPVYLNDESGESIGTAEQIFEHNSDTFVFHLPSDICKKLSTNLYDIGIDYEFIEPGADPANARITLKSIILVVKQGSEPIPRRSGTFATVRH